MENIEVIERDFEENFIVISNGIKSSDKATSSRVAYLFDEGFIVKFGYGYRSELELWELLEEDDKKYFTTIYGSGEFNGAGYIIAERAYDDVNFAVTEEHLEILRTLKKKYGLFDMHFEKDENEEYTYSRRHNIAINSKGEMKIYDFEAHGM